MNKRILAVTLAIGMLLSGCQISAEKNETSLVSTTTTTTVTTTQSTTTTASKTTGTTSAVDATQSTASTAAQVLDPAYQRLLLVNAENPLPEGFDNTTLVSVPQKYCNGSLNQIDEGIYPYVMAMLKAAWSDGVKLYVRSPYRSYATQRMLFTNKVNSVLANGTPEDQAEAVAAKAVARPGTSEHQTGLAIDFNTASSGFEGSAAHKWMKEHAADYGFIMRYPADKTQITGIMYEPWHWRFVGINVAKEINQLGVSFEEYIAMKHIQ